MSKSTLLAAASLFGVAAFALPVGAQMVEKTTTTTTTSSSGSIAELGPDTLVVRTEQSPTPLSYTYSKTTTYVDENGQPVSVETVRSGAPVTVYYTEDAGVRTATKVVVRKQTDSAGKTTTIEEKRTTTTTP